MISEQLARLGPPLGGGGGGAASRLWDLDADGLLGIFLAAGARSDAVDPSPSAKACSASKSVATRPTLGYRSAHVRQDWQHCKLIG
ncbi:hypothetical protein ACIA5H_12545 [Nocardia sp. NPDC051900]|uniref:hypothetical protein n=1 Tax=Nocardia sp. NPDC051900 TaxID=3364326 RepID=UPI0037AAE9AE